MKLIVGLGNPGEKYHTTRHNAGFLALDYFLTAERAIEHLPHLSWENNFNSRITTLTLGDDKILFIKPQTFMNESGRAVAEIINFYKVSIAENLLVLHDEIDLPLGKIRETNSSSDAGHNGIKSIMSALGTQNFPRIRIGVEGRESRNDMPTDVFVLAPFKENELKQLEEEVFPEVAAKIDAFINK